MIYMNEIDPYCAQWLQNLMDAGVLPPGHIDTRSIEDVTPNDLAGYTQCHFFAGLGGWIYALDLAGWPRDRPVWTGSCPCQPFSAAGKGLGFADERHLWPAFHWLIEQCRPPVVFGEQVASADGLKWLDLVQADLEGAGYACGAVDTCAAGFGAPHIRQRLYWVADAYGFGPLDVKQPAHGRGATAVTERGTTGGLAHAERAGLSQRGNREVLPIICCNCGENCWLADSESPRRGICNTENVWTSDAQINTSPDSSNSPTNKQQRPPTERPGPTNGFWGAADWLLCRDGKWRPVEPGTFPLAHGIPGRVGRLRAYGNAINPWQAAEFVAAFMGQQVRQELAAA